MPCGRSLDSGQALPERRRNRYLLPFRPASGLLASRWSSQDGFDRLPSYSRRGGESRGISPPKPFKVQGVGGHKIWPLAPCLAPIPAAHYPGGRPHRKKFGLCTPRRVPERLPAEGGGCIRGSRLRVRLQAGRTARTSLASSQRMVAGRWGVCARPSVGSFLRASLWRGVALVRRVFFSP